ncbi:8-amino-7-oxononanoate synthase [Hippea maritima]|uniref:8-amino-7-ketopelargonate synthase n=1 Tax=Hippea maritima (strain ATCC 700847 / DSM 10411 / MH2) TaxID=760142 RepID=F2LTY3_HIPMA|nr:8-amino-7-oxononanoate synthase [Hippea maritima]AEA33382.1 8-amino-7-oxononanoate synthase [Hippea maritima DSM 10411]
MSYESFFENKLKELKKDNLLRSIPQIDAGAEKYITINAKKCLNLSSNNYLGLSKNKRLIEKAKEGISIFGCSSSASRIVTGNYSLYDELELEIANFKGYQKCIVFGCGYVTNVSVIPALCDKEWTIFSDKLNHASIIDGARLSLAKHIRYKHNDIDHLEKLIKKCQTPKKLIVTDTVFSMDGDIANLRQIAAIADKYGALVMVDEAHATGIFGHGRGVVHELGLVKQIHINMGTFSKALGSYGAYVCSSKLIIDYLINKARGFIYSTSLPPSVIASNLEALKLIKKNDKLSKRLLSMSEKLRKSLKAMGYDILNSQSQIIPVIIPNREKLFRLRNFLISNGIYAPAIRLPTVPKNTDRLRISLRADITDNELDKIIEVFGQMRQYL